jgi:hypothetical protein
MDIYRASIAGVSAEKTCRFASEARQGRVLLPQSRAVPLSFIPYDGRFLPRAVGGVFGGACRSGAWAGSSFARAERNGSKRGAGGNLSSSRARRMLAVMAACSSSVRSIVGMVERQGCGDNAVGEEMRIMRPILSTDLKIVLTAFAVLTGSDSRISDLVVLELATECRAVRSRGQDRPAAARWHCQHRPRGCRGRKSRGCRSDGEPCGATVRDVHP